jgi:hypothetical protein
LQNKDYINQRDILVVDFGMPPAMSPVCYQHVSAKRRDIKKAKEIQRWHYVKQQFMEKVVSANQRRLKTWWPG